MLQRSFFYASRFLSTCAVRLPSHLKANIVGATGATITHPGPRRWPIHVGRPLSEILPALVLNGRVFEACSNIVYHFVAERDRENSRRPGMGVKKHDDISNLIAPPCFAESMTSAMSCLFALDYDQLNKEQILAVLNPDTLRAVSPKLHPDTRKELRTVVTAIFRRVLLCNPDYLTRLNFDAITTIVGMGQVFHFLEHAGIPVVSRDVRQNLNNKIPNKQRSVVSARETNEPHCLMRFNDLTHSETAATTLSKDYTSFHASKSSASVSRLSPSALDAIFDHYLVHYPSPSSTYSCVRLAMQLIYAEHYSVTQRNTDDAPSEATDIPSGYFPVFAIHSSLGGSSWSLANILEAFIRLQHKDHLFLLLHILPSANLFLESVELLKQRDCVTGRPLYRWSVSEVVGIADLIKHAVDFYARYLTLWVEKGKTLEEHSTELQQYLSAQERGSVTALRDAFFQERIQELEHFLRGKEHGILFFSPWMCEMVSRHSGSDAYRCSSLQTREPIQTVNTELLKNGSPVSSSSSASLSFPGDTSQSDKQKPPSSNSLDGLVDHGIHGLPPRKQARRFTQSGEIEALYDEYIYELQRLQAQQSKTFAVQNDDTSENDHGCNAPWRIASQDNINRMTLFYTSCAPLRLYVQRRLGVTSPLTTQTGAFNYVKLLKNLSFASDALQEFHQSSLHQWRWPQSAPSPSFVDFSSPDSAVAQYLEELTSSSVRYCGRSVKELEDPKIKRAAIQGTDQHEPSSNISLSWGRKAHEYHDVITIPWLNASPLFLPLKSHQVTVVSSSSDLVQMIRYFSSRSVDIVGIDIEWSPPATVSVATLACPDRCFVLDIPTLVAVSSVTHHVLVNFMLWLFGHRETIKICYYFDVDITRLFAALVTDAVLMEMKPTLEAGSSVCFIPPTTYTHDAATASDDNGKASIHKISRLLANSLCNVIDLRNPRERRRLRSKENRDRDCVSEKTLRNAFDHEYLSAASFLKRKTTKNIIADTPLRKDNVPQEVINYLRWPSLGHMVQHLFPGYTLERDDEFLNWNARPLEDAHLQFAALDALILPLLEVALRDKGWMPSVVLGMP